MPQYTYRCQGKCQGEVEVFHRMTADPPKQCPNCQTGGKKWSRVIGAPHIRGSGKPRTFGEQSDANVERIGEEGLKRMAEAEEKRLSGVGVKRKLPPGARSIRSTEQVERMWDPLDTKKVDVTNKKKVDKYIRTGKTE